jgi:predicted short-subunit dehydrogenase-like oxidoreductase (DUF2520 family)
MKVVIVGSGNVATVLGRKILAAGNEILQVAGRDKERIASLASILNSTETCNVLNISLEADLYVIAVSDSSISGVASQLKLNDKIVVHTAAAVSKEVLAGCSKNYGILYPLQTIRKELERIPPIPVLIDGSNLQTQKSLLSFAAEWAECVAVADDDERLKFHIAAVFANNFTNHLLTISEQFCKEEKLKFSVLYPLIEETITRIREKSPSALQTGPAIRKDINTLKKHEQMLSNQPKVKELYTIITESIMNLKLVDG